MSSEDILKMSSRHLDEGGYILSVRLQYHTQENTGPENMCDIVFKKTKGRSGTVRGNHISSFVRNASK